MSGITAAQLSKIASSKHPFNYDLGLKIIPSRYKEAPVIICCHGYGADNQIGDAVYSTGAVRDHILSFNFPDFNCIAKQYDPKKSTFGSIAELLPFFYVIKKCVIDGQQEKINLYGFSAGGAAIINMLSALNQAKYDQQLKDIGISLEDKEKIKSAVEKGIIILECPMKSIEEIMDVRGKSEEFSILAKRYAANNMRPIDVIHNLKGLTLHILLYFEKPDDILGNRDDAFFIERLRAANKGKTEVISGSYGGHNSYHKSLWNLYKKI